MALRRSFAFPPARLLSLRLSSSHPPSPSDEFDPRKETKSSSFHWKQIPSKISLYSRSFASTVLACIKEPARISAGWNQFKIAASKEWQHYKMGTVMLISDTKTAFRLVRRILKGEHPTRRERRMLVRTSADLFRLVPFSFFVIVPFAEFALPFCLKLFPNMLPSQYTAKFQEQEKVKRQLALRLDLAEFLNDTLATMIKDKESKLASLSETKNLEVILSDVRDGKRVSNTSLLEVAKLFQDEITLDNISRPQLVSLCKYMGLSPYGPDVYLRQQLRKQLRAIKSDDEIIMKEGLESLTEEEIKQACLERGMRASGVPAGTYRRNLQQWLELSLKFDIPASLLILSRAFTISEVPVTPAEAIQNTIVSMEDDVVEDTLLESGHLSDPSKILEAKSRRNELIEEERKEEYISLRVDNEVVATMVGEKPADEPTVLPSKPVSYIVQAAANFVLKQTESNTVHGKKLTMQQLKMISEALTVMTSDSAVTKEKEKLNELKSELKDIIEDEVAQHDFPRISAKLAKMMQSLEKRVQQADDKIGHKLQKLDMDKDGVLSRDEIHAAVQEYIRGDVSGGQIADILDSDKDNQVAVKSLEEIAVDQDELAEDKEKMKHKEEKLEKKGNQVIIV